MNFQDIQVLLQHPIAFHRVFADIAGGACPGLFLSQLFYWAGKTKDPEGWFYKSQDEWSRETALSRREQESARRALREKKILEEKKEGIPCRLFFKLNGDRLLDEISSILNRRSRASADQFEQNERTGIDEIARPVGTKAPDKYGGNVQTSMYKSARQDGTKTPDIPYTKTSTEITSEIPPYVPPAGGEQEEEQEGGENASLKEEEEPGVKEAPSLCYKQQEEPSRKEQIDLGLDQSSAPPEAVESNNKSSGFSNLANAAEIASRMVEQIRRDVEQRATVEGDSSHSATTPKPILKNHLRHRGAEGDWQCPVPEKYWDFLRDEAERLIRETNCPRVDARDRVIGKWNRHPGQADVKFEDWMLEQQRRQEQPPSKRRDLEAMPYFPLESRQDAAVVERIAEYHRLGEEEFLKQKTWHRLWLEHARKYNLI